MSRTVEIAHSNNICISCGICKNVCPKSCITYKREKGLFQPLIDNSKCIDCGLCSKVCPGLNMSFNYSQPIDAVYGFVKKSYNAWSRNEECRYKSASGGVISTIISELILNDIYDSAFVVDTYDYSSQVLTKRITKQDITDGDFYNSVPKSRYLPVSHENLISYIKKNRDEKVIIIGTSCALQGISKAINTLNLDREKYLLVGLFCDKVYNYNIYQYYDDNFFDGKNLSSLHFKNKESGGWPGNMKLFFDDDTTEYLDKSERIKTKDFFMPERCLYCIDKLNIYADISLGDNYTNINSSEKGSNSVIIRTELGEKIWNYVSNAIEYCPVDITEIHKAQYLDGRVNNLYFAELKSRKINKKNKNKIQLISNVKGNKNMFEYEYAWKNKLLLLSQGISYSKNYSLSKNKFSFINKLLYYCYRIKSKFM